MPESTLLSHDLFEGHSPAPGLASDIEVVEEFPSRYDVAAARQHRWARGDWQLLPWIFGRGDASLGNRGTSSLPLIGLWRCSTICGGHCLCRQASWPCWRDGPCSHSAAVWTCFILSTIAVPTLLPVLAAIVPRRARITARSHLRALGADLWLALSQTALAVTFLTHQAWSMTDAIGRTLFRLFVSRRHLLEWKTAAYAKFGQRLGLLGFYRLMAGGVVIGIIAAIVVWCSGRDAWLVATPFVVLWISSPAVARWTSLSPLVAGRLSVSEADARALRLVARRTWRYFETFVTVADHMLPPDNFQEDPNPVLAHRTSPTNLGLYLLSTISARDFGWAGTTETIERLEATLAKMSSLQRFRGHFYNWYDTGDLRPLDPRYVSSVDSGNLAGHLIAVANACRQWIGRPLATSRLFAGIEDALSLARQAVRELPDDRRTQFITAQELDSAFDALGAALGAGHSLPEELPAQLMDLAHQATTVVDIAQTLAQRTRRREQRRDALLGAGGTEIDR